MSPAHPQTHNRSPPPRAFSLTDVDQSCNIKLLGFAEPENYRHQLRTAYFLRRNPQAGFDMRAWRLSPAQQACIFELDHPQTSLAKQVILKSALGPLPERIRCIGVDFNRQSIMKALLDVGFDVSRPACWIWEGVTNYLTAEAVDSSLRQIAETAVEGSILLLTYIDRAVLATPDRYVGALRLVSRLRSYGEPWTFGLDPGEVRSYLAARGFELLKDVNVAEVWQRAGRSGSGTHGYEFYRLASARVRE